MAKASGRPPIKPHICVLGALEAIDFYERAFGAECVVKHMDEDGGRVLFATLSLFGGEISMHDEFPEWSNHVLSPEEWPTSFAVGINLDEPHQVDAIMDKAARNGAEIVRESEDIRNFGVRYGRVRDPFGHVWAFHAPLPRN